MGIRKLFLKKYILALILAHCLMSGFFILRWFHGSVALSFLNYFHLPRSERIFTLGMNEYRAILDINKNLPADARILWLPEVSAVINYYIYPRRIYQDKIYDPREKIVLERSFLDSRNIGYVFVDYGKLYPIDVKK